MKILNVFFYHILTLQLQDSKNQVQCFHDQKKPGIAALVSECHIFKSINDNSTTFIG